MLDRRIPGALPSGLRNVLRGSLATARSTEVHDCDGLRVGVVTAFPPGRNSLNEFGFHLVRHLEAQDEIAEVVVYHDVTAAGSPEPMRGVSFRPAWTFNRLSNIVRVVREVLRSKPDAVILNLQFATFGDRRLPGGAGLFLPWALRLVRTPSIVVLHNLADNVDMQDAGFAGNRVTAGLMKTAGRLLTRALLKADLVALTIPRYVEFLQRSYGARNALLAPHGSFDDLAPPPVYESGTRRRILAFGKWGTYKRVDILVDAYSELLRRGYQDVELVLAGTDSPNSPGYMESVKQERSDVPGLTFTGYVAESDVPGIFSSATVVAFPYTSTTGSSGVLHQAGEYGCAAVLPRIGDLVDIIEEEGFRGVYFDPGSSESLADALAKVLDDPELRESLGKRNFAAAAGIPMSDVVHWHVTHIQRLLAR